MGRPVHDRQQIADGNFPSARHFEGRKRQWEVRMQLRFKQLPKGPLHLGFEYTKYQRLPALVKRAEALIVASVSRIMGPVYKSAGDDPAAMSGVEAEPPCASVPVYAFDQLIVSEVGEEPDITSSLEGSGWLRADGLAAYRQRVESTLGTPSADKVYTMCVWSVSQMIDVLNWTVGVPGGLRMDANRLIGAPPMVVALYELDCEDGQQDTRHLISRKTYYARFAYWSAMSLPEPEHLRKVLQLPEKSELGDDEDETLVHSEYTCAGFWARLGWSCDGFSLSNLISCAGPRK
jgi:hypothetical protein